MDKAVILARGLGTRMRKAQTDVELNADQQAAAEAGSKAMMPVGRPFLDYVLNALADAGYSRICLVIGPEHDAIREYYASITYRRLQIDFATQESPNGTADAVLAAESFVDGDSFATLNSDNLYPAEALGGLRGLSEPGLAVFEREQLIEHSNVPADRIARFAVVETDARGYLQRVVEKPEQHVIDTLPPPVGVSMNCWRFDARIFEACRAIPLSPRGELEIPTAVQHAIDHMTVPFRVLYYESGVLDLTGQTDVAGIAKRVEGISVDL